MFSWENINEEGMRNFGEVLMNLSSLQDLNLEFPLEKITDAGLESLSEGLSGLLRLENLELVFGERDKRGINNQITDEGISSFSAALENLTCLKKLRLKFGECEEVTGAGIKDLGFALRDLVCLEEIYFSFGFCGKFKDKEIERFCHGFKGLNSLQNVTLFIQGFKINGFGLHCLARVLKKLVFLKAIRVDFSCSVNEKIQERFERDLRSLPFLKHLDINF